MTSLDTHPALTRGQVSDLEFRLGTERQAKDALQAQVGELNERLTNVVQLTERASRGHRSSRGGAAAGGAKAAATRGGGRQALNNENLHSGAGGADDSSPHHGLGEMTNSFVNSGVDAPPSDEPKRSRWSRRGSTRGGDTSNQQHHQAEAEAAAVLCAGDGKAPKPSKLKQLRSMAGFRKKADANPEEPFFDVAAAAGHGGMPEPTPVARRTRGAHAAKAAGI